MCSTLPSAKFVHVWFEFLPSYLSRKKGTSGTFFSFGLRPQLQKTFLQFPFFYFGNLAKTQIRRGQILPQTCRAQISKQNTIIGILNIYNFINLSRKCTLNDPSRLEYSIPHFSFIIISLITYVCPSIVYSFLLSCLPYSLYAWVSINEGYAPVRF